MFKEKLKNLKEKFYKDVGENINYSSKEEYKKLLI